MSTVPFYTVVAWIKHKWLAKGRHGTHSPFVYSFIENILRDTSVIDKRSIIRIPSLPLRFENIVSRISAYNRCRVIMVQADVAGRATKEPDLLVLDGRPTEWIQTVNDVAPLRADAIVVATNIHQSPEHGAAWNRMCKDDRVRMSIDLYGIGLLLFREEFKVKQHFVLKYR